MSGSLTGLAVAAALVLSAPLARAQEVPPCRRQSVNVEHANYAPESKTAASFLCVQGSPARVHLEFRQKTIASALSALRTTYNISFRSSIALNEIHSGFYAGSLRQVTSQLLSNYNYVIRMENARLDVDIFSRIGEQATAAPILAEVAEKPVRHEHQVSRIH